MNSFAQLNSGDILFVGWYGDGGDGLAFVTMTTIPAGTEIYFNDNEWNGSAVGSGGAFNSLTEGAILWTNDLGGDLPAGVVVSIEGIDMVSTITSSCGSVTTPGGTGNGTLRVNSTNEVIYAYTGTSVSSPTTFISAIANDGFTGTFGTLSGTGLTDGVDAINLEVLDPDCDVAVFVPGTYTAASIMNTANWAVQDGSGDQGQDGVYPDYPDDLPVGTSSCSIVSTLPVELMFFEVENQNNIAKIRWQTLSEINNDKFEILRSQNGLDFYKIGTVNGQGNSTEITSYEFQDEQPLTGISYYRLKQIDFDGTASFTEIKSFVKSEDSPLDIKVYPNPIIGDQVLIRSNEMDRIFKVEVYNGYGQLIKVEQTKEDGIIKLQGFKERGIYLVKISFDKECITKKLIR